MVKYIHYFKSNPSNLAALLINELGADKHGLVEQVKVALQNLEREVFIERNGDVYSFLTDKEKEIENDILSTTVELSEVRKQLLSFIQSEFPLNKVNFKGESHFKKLGLWLDDQQQSTVQSEIAIHFFTPFYVLDHTIDVIKAQSTGRDELRVVFQDDKRLRDEVNLLAKTNKFFQQKAGSNDPLVQRAIQQKQAGVSQRTAEIRQLVIDGLGTATLVFNGAEIPSSDVTPKSKLESALQAVLAQIFFKLALLGSPLPDEATLSSVFQRQVDTDYDSAEQEVLTYINSKLSNHQTITLFQVLENFSKKEYGWPELGTKYLICLLVKGNKLRLSIDGNAISQASILGALRAPQVKLEQTLLSVPADVPPAKLSVVRTFAIEFLSIPNPSNDTQQLGQEASNAVNSMISEVANMAGQDFPFIKMLSPFSSLISGLRGKSPDWFFTDDFESQIEELKRAKESFFNPVKAFLSNQAQVEIFRTAKAFSQVNHADLEHLGGEDVRRLKELLVDENLLSVRNAIVDLKSYHANASKALEDELVMARIEHLDALQAEVANIKSSPEYVSADDSAKSAFEALVDSTVSRVSAIKSITQVQLSKAQFQNSVRPNLWNILVKRSSASGTTEMVVNLSSIQVEHRSPQLLASENDVDDFLSDLKSAMIQVLKTNKKIAR